MKSRTLPLIAAAALALASTGASAGPVVQGVNLNASMLQGMRINGPVLQGMKINGPILQGMRLNGPGIILQGVQFNGVQFNGPGLVLQGNQWSGSIAFDRNDCSAPAVLGHSLLSGLAVAQIKVRLAQR